MYFESRATRHADRLNRMRQSKEPKMTSRFGATGFMLLLFSEKENNIVVTRIGEVRSLLGVPF